MRTDFVAALDAEIAELERQLLAIPIFAKLSQLRCVRELYVVSEESRGRATSGSGDMASRRDARASRKKEQLLQAAADKLEGRSVPTPTADLYASLTADGLEIPGQKPRNYLSALLSHNARFQSHGRAGWTLVLTHAHNSTGAGHEPAPAPSFESRSDRAPNKPGHDLLNQPAKNGEKGGSGALATTR
jgi:hypothetical protein